MFEVSKVTFVGGSMPADRNRLTVYSAYGIANGAGGGAGQSVAVAVSIPADNNVSLPSNGNYLVDVELSQDATYYISAKSATGFTVNIQPRLASQTIAAGTFNVQASA